MKPVCKYTHGFISLGTCPWCEQPIADGQIRPDLPARDVAFRQWNYSAMLKALDDEDVEVRSNVPSSLLSHPPKAEEALPVLRMALQNSEYRVR